MVHSTHGHFIARMCLPNFDCTEHIPALPSVATSCHSTEPIPKNDHTASSMASIVVLLPFRAQNRRAHLGWPRSEAPRHTSRQGISATIVTAPLTTIVAAPLTVTVVEQGACCVSGGRSVPTADLWLVRHLSEHPADYTLVHPGAPTCPTGIRATVAPTVTTGHLRFLGRHHIIHGSCTSTSASWSANTRLTERKRRQGGRTVGMTRCPDGVSIHESTPPQKCLAPSLGSEILKSYACRRYNETQ